MPSVILICVETLSTASSHAQNSAHKTSRYRWVQVCVIDRSHRISRLCIITICGPSLSLDTQGAVVSGYELHAWNIDSLLPVRLADYESDADSALPLLLNEIRINPKELPSCRATVMIYQLNSLSFPQVKLKFRSNLPSSLLILLKLRFLTLSIPLLFPSLLPTYCDAIVVVATTHVIRVIACGSRGRCYRHRSDRCG